MRSVLDEGVPDDIVEPLRGFGAKVDPFRPEWRGFRNGALLAAIEQAGYALLLTNDKNMGFQLNLHRLRLAIVALPITRPDILSARASDLFETMRSIQTGQVVSIAMDGRRFVRGAGPGKATLTDELARLPPFQL